MKATLQFDLTDQEQEMEHLRCVKSLDMALVLWEIRYNMKRKYENMEFGEEAMQIIEKVFEDIINLYEERNLNLDELVC